MPTLVIASVVVVLAFVLGRATGGGDTVVRRVVAAPVAATTTTGAPISHTVAKGESLSGIASQYGVTAIALAAANGITDFNTVFVGQVLSVPAPVPVAATTTTTTKKK